MRGGVVGCRKGMAAVWRSGRFAFGTGLCLVIQAGRRDYI